MIMFRSYLRIAIRSLFKQKLYSLINIVGLAIGIAACALIYLFVMNEWSYDKFHRNAERLYRVYITEDPPQRDAFSYVEAPFYLAEALEQTFPEVEQAVRLVVRTDIVRYGERNFTQRYHLADHEFFETFSFPLIRRSKADVLRDLNSVVLTESTAEKIFGQSDPVNKRLSIKIGEAFSDFIVSGIARDVPSNSSIKFDMIIPIDNVNKYISNRALGHWFNVFFETYVQLDRTLDSSEIEEKLRSVVKKHYPEGYVDIVSLGLQPIIDIHLNPNIPQGFEPTSDPVYSLIMLAIALLILGVACVNFVTLAIGRSAGRAKEVGVRKVLGALKSQIIRQFLGEALLMSLSALVLGILLVELFLPTFNNITNKKLSLSYGIETLLFMLGLMLLVGGATGSYPSFILSRYQPVRVMKNDQGWGIKGRNIFVRSLVIGQFAISIGLIVSTFLMSDQLRFLLNKDLGFDREHVLVIQNHSTEDQNHQVVERLRNALANRTEILGVCGASSTFARDWTTMGYTADDGTFKQFFQLTVDYDYLETMGIELAEGRNFSREYSTDPREAFIVNEALVEYFNWDSALGKSLPGGEFPPHRIIGVVKDFNFESLGKDIRPVIMVLDPTTLLRGVNDVSTSYSPGLLNFINVRISQKNVRASVELVRKTWQKIAPQHPFLFSFLDQDVQQQYQEIDHWGRIVAYASLFTILIACLGLFGLAALSVARRTKEIGIRKVLGASTTNIVLMLSREFGMLVVVANIVAWPVAFLAVEQWLQDFAYRVDMDFLKFLLAGSIALVIALSTVSYQSIKAALTDPVETIRYE